MLGIARQHIPAKSPISYRFVYSHTSMVSSTTTQLFTAVGIPGDWAVTGVRVRILSQFVGTSLSSLQIQTGTATNPAAYSGVYELTRTPSSSTIQVSAPLAEAVSDPHDIIVTFLSVGCSMNALTGGEVEVILRAEPL